MAATLSKRCPRIHSEQPLVPGRTVVLDGDRGRYLSRVLRSKPGDTALLFDGGGAEFRAEIREIRRDRVLLDVLERRDRDVESPFGLRLLQGVPRGDRMDTIVQKATELGVHRITPLLTEFGVVRLDGERAAKRARHWQGVAASACEQCGRNRLPQVDEPVAFRDFIGANPPGSEMRIVLDPSAAAGLSGLPAAAGVTFVLVGPEGGLSEAELGLARDAGFQGLRVGPRTLRTETAAIATIALLQARFGDLR